VVDETTVTYIGSSGVLIHPGPSGMRYQFHRQQPLLVVDEQDITFYRRKEAKGSPFRVIPKLKIVPAVEKPLTGGFVKRFGLKVEKPVKGKPKDKKKVGKSKKAKIPRLAP